MDREKVIHGLECCTEWDSCNKCPYETPNEYDIAECTLSLHTDALALLKEQENQKQNWLKQIADTQYLNAPCEWQSEDQRLYAHGVWDGLQIAWDILTEGDKK